MDKYGKLDQRMTELELDTFVVLSEENRRYITGFRGSNGIVVYSAAGRYIITDSRYTEQACKEAPDYTVITYNLSGSFAALKETLEKLGAKRVGYESKLVDDYTIRGLRELCTAQTFIPTTDLLLSIRKVKTDAELTDLRRAIGIADEGLLRIVPLLKAGMTEREFAIELEYSMKKLGSEKESFDTIVVSGVRTSLPHGKPSDKPIAMGDMVTVDYGAVYNGYHSDITRTLWFGEPSKRMQEIFAIVDESQQAAFAAIRVGAVCKDIDAAHRAVFFAHDVEQYSLRGLGHGIGLQIHEWPRVVMNNDEVLENNMIFTVEPGLYLPDIGGVRTEDVVIVTESCAEVVTAAQRKIVIE